MHTLTWWREIKRKLKGPVVEATHNCGLFFFFWKTWLKGCQACENKSGSSNHGDMRSSSPLQQCGVWIPRYSNKKYVRTDASSGTSSWLGSLLKPRVVYIINLVWLRHSHYTAKQAAPQSQHCPSHFTRHDDTGPQSHTSASEHRGTDS